MNLIFIFSLLVVFAGFALAARGFLNLEIQYNLDNPTLDRIEDAEPGLAEVSGTVEPADEQIDAPISGDACVLFAVAVEEKHQQGDGPLWQVSSSAQNGVPFYLTDESGAILVDPEGIDHDLSEKNVYEVPNGVVPPDPIRTAGESLRESEPEWARDLDLSLFDCQTSRDTRYVEYLLEPGEEYSVFGAVMERHRARNLYYDDKDTYVVYRNESTPNFSLSTEPHGEEIEQTVRVTPWMVTGGVLLLAGMLGLARSLV